MQNRLSQTCSELLGLAGESSHSPAFGTCSSAELIRGCKVLSLYMGSEPCVHFRVFLLSAPEKKQFAELIEIRCCCNVSCACNCMIIQNEFRVGLTWRKLFIRIVFQSEMPLTSFNKIFLNALVI